MCVGERANKSISCLTTSDETGAKRYFLYVSFFGVDATRCTDVCGKDALSVCLCEGCCAENVLSLCEEASVLISGKSVLCSARGVTESVFVSTDGTGTISRYGGAGLCCVSLFCFCEAEMLSDAADDCFVCAYVADNETALLCLSLRVLSAATIAATCSRAVRCECAETATMRSPCASASTRLARRGTRVTGCSTGTATLMRRHASALVLIRSGGTSDAGCAGEAEDETDSEDDAVAEDGV